MDWNIFLVPKGPPAGAPFSQTQSLKLASKDNINETNLLLVLAGIEAKVGSRVQMFAGCTKVLNRNEVPISIPG